jgi:hypothetical protein
MDYIIEETGSRKRHFTASKNRLEEGLQSWRREYNLLGVFSTK